MDLTAVRIAGSIVMKIRSVSSNFMCRQRSIDSVNLFSHREEASVVYVIGCDVIMIMSSFAMITKAVKVFNS